MKLKKLLEKITALPWRVNIWTTERRTVESDLGKIAEVHRVHTDEGLSNKYNAEYLVKAANMLPKLARALEGMRVAGTNLVLHSIYYRAGNKKEEILKEYERIVKECSIECLALLEKFE